MTDRPSGGEGVRIAATRAGQHDSDAGGDVAGGNGVDPDAAGPAGRNRPPRPDGPDATRRRAAIRSSRLRRTAPATTRTVVTPPVPTPPTPRTTTVAAAPVAVAVPRPPRPVSPARAKVLRQRRRRRRLVIAFTAFLIFCTLLVGSVSAYVQTRLGQIKRVQMPALADDVPGAVMNVLLVGSDSRANLEGKDAVGFGKDTVGGQRSDTIMLLHIDPKEEKAAIVSVPRDLYVPIAGTTYSDRVNTAFSVGGPDQLVATVQQTLGITINHYVQVDFVGFRDVVNTVGGVTIYLPYPVRDSGSGLDLGKSGCFELDGQKALAWVRSRDIEFQINGTWQADPRGDLGRIERQQDFIRRMMKKAISSGLTNPLQLNRLIGIGVKDVTFDSALSTKDITALARRFSSLDPDRVALHTLPTDPADIDGKAVLKLQTAQAKPMIDLLNGKAPIDGGPATSVPAAGATTTAPKGATPTTVGVRPADVKVRVLNGVGTAGIAAKTATSLTNAGFAVADKGDAPAPAPKTTITYATGQVAKAQALQGALASPALLKEDPTLKAVDVSLTLGADFTGVKPSVSAGATPGASTTLAPTTTAAPQINPVPLPKGAVPPC